MKTQHAIYNETYDNAAYKALTAQIDGRYKPSEQEKTDAINIIIDLALAYSNPVWIDTEPVRSPYIIKKTSELAEFAFEAGLTSEFLRQCQQYFNRFRAAAVAEAMVIDWFPSKSVPHMYLIQSPVTAVLQYRIQEYRIRPFGSVMPTLYIDAMGSDLEIPLLNIGRAVDDTSAVTSDFVADEPLVRKALAKIALAGLNLFAPVYS